jgi:hypothetical protein
MSPTISAHAGDLGREGGADDQGDLAGGVPFAWPPAGRRARTAFLAADIEKLQVGAAGVGGAAEQDDALVRVAR